MICLIPKSIRSFRTIGIFTTGSMILSYRNMTEFVVPYEGHGIYSRAITQRAGYRRNIGCRGRTGFLLCDREKEDILLGQYIGELSCRENLSFLKNRFLIFLECFDSNRGVWSVTCIPTISLRHGVNDMQPRGIYLCIGYNITMPMP